MKVDTNKKLTPMANISQKEDTPDNCFFHENKYIQNGDAALNKDNDADAAPEETQSREEFGFAGYQPFIYTPVKRSSRDTADNRLNDILDAKGVEELIGVFAKLLIGDAKKQKTETTPISDEEEEGSQCDLGRYTTAEKSKNSTGHPSQ